jgi:hypothetical protein
MVLTSGDGTLIATQTINGYEVPGSFTTFSTNVVVPDSSLVGQPLTVSIAVDPDGSTGSGNDNWFVDNVQIQEIQSHLLGDANGDGTVDINDLTIVLTNYGKTGMTWSQGAMDGDPTGTVDINDLTVVLANYDKTSGTGLAAVPEPSSAILFGLGAVGLFALVRRRRTR